MREVVVFRVRITDPNDKEHVLQLLEALGRILEGMGGYHSDWKEYDPDDEMLNDR